MFLKAVCHINSIQTETELAYLFKMPYKSVYYEYTFWFPKSMTEIIGETKTHIKLKFPHSFKFNLKKQTRVGNEFVPVDSIYVDAKTMSEKFR